MKLSDILKTAGAAAIRHTIPNGSLVLELINSFLPDDKKLSGSATGAEAEQAIESLPADQRAMLMERELDVKLAEINSWTYIQQSLNEADASGASTRPKIALMMSYVVMFTVLVFMSIWAISVIRHNTEILELLSGSWELVLTLLGTPTALLRSYFGMRTEEKVARYASAAGQPKQSVFAEIISAIRK